MVKTIDEIIKIIKTSSQYEFLYKEDKIKRNTILLTLSGSISYGTNIETSDIDLRGVCLESTNELLGLSYFEQYEDQNTDTVIFGLKKFMKLCLANNPNILELLGTKEEHILKLTPEGQLLRENLHLFLSKKIIKTHGHFANNQIRKLKHAISQPSSQNYTKLYKTAAHIIRLLRTGAELLDGKAFQVYRPHERTLYLDIRKGKFSFKELFAMIEEAKLVFEQAAKRTILPDFPNKEQVEALMIQIYKSKLTSEPV